jgi:hypothetical protein
MGGEDGLVYNGKSTQAAAGLIRGPIRSPIPAGPVVPARTRFAQQPTSTGGSLSQATGTRVGVRKPVLVLRRAPVPDDENLMVMGVQRELDNRRRVSPDRVEDAVLWFEAGVLARALVEALGRFFQDLDYASAGDGFFITGFEPRLGIIARLGILTHEERGHQTTPCRGGGSQ